MILKRLVALLLIPVLLTTGVSPWVGLARGLATAFTVLTGQRINELNAFSEQALESPDLWMQKQLTNQSHLASWGRRAAVAAIVVGTAFAIARNSGDIASTFHAFTQTHNPEVILALAFTTLEAIILLRYRILPGGMMTPFDASENENRDHRREAFSIGKRQEEALQRLLKKYQALRGRLSLPEFKAALAAPNPEESLLKVLNTKRGITNTKTLARSMMDEINAFAQQVCRESKTSAAASKAPVVSARDQATDPTALIGVSVQKTPPSFAAQLNLAAVKIESNKPVSRLPETPEERLALALNKLRDAPDSYELKSFAGAMMEQIANSHIAAGRTDDVLPMVFETISIYRDTVRLIIQDAIPKGADRWAILWIEDDPEAVYALWRERQSDFTILGDEVNRVGNRLNTLVLVIKELGTMHSEASKLLQSADPIASDDHRRQAIAASAAADALAGRRPYIEASIRMAIQLTLSDLLFATDDKDIAAELSREAGDYCMTIVDAIRANRIPPGVSRKQFDAMMEAKQETIERFTSKETHARYYGGYLFMLLNRFEESEQELKRLPETDMAGLSPEEQGNAYVWLADTSLRRREWVKAIGYSRQAQELTENPITRYYVAAGEVIAHIHLHLDTDSLEPALEHVLFGLKLHLDIFGLGTKATLRDVLNLLIACEDEVQSHFAKNYSYAENFSDLLLLAVQSFVGLDRPLEALEVLSVARRFDPTPRARMLDIFAQEVQAAHDRRWDEYERLAIQRAGLSAELSPDQHAEIAKIVSMLDSKLAAASAELAAYRRQQEEAAAILERDRHLNAWRDVLKRAFIGTLPEPWFQHDLLEFLPDWSREEVSRRWSTYGGRADGACAFLMNSLPSSDPSRAESLEKVRARVVAQFPLSRLLVGTRDASLEDVMLWLCERLGVSTKEENVTRMMELYTAWLLAGDDLKWESYGVPRKFGYRLTDAIRQEIMAGSARLHPSEKADWYRVGAGVLIDSEGLRAFRPRRLPRDMDRVSSSYTFRNGQTAQIDLYLADNSVAREDPHGELNTVILPLAENRFAILLQMRVADFSGRVFEQTLDRAVRQVFLQVQGFRVDASRRLARAHQEMHKDYSVYLPSTRRAYQAPIGDYFDAVSHRDDQGAYRTAERMAAQEAYGYLEPIVHAAKTLYTTMLEGEASPEGEFDSSVVNAFHRQERVARYDFIQEHRDGVMRGTYSRSEAAVMNLLLESLFRDMTSCVVPPMRYMAAMWRTVRDLRAALAPEVDEGLNDLFAEASAAIENPIESFTIQRTGESFLQTASQDTAMHLVLAEVAPPSVAPLSETATQKETRVGLLLKSFYPDLYAHFSKLVDEVRHASPLTRRNLLSIVGGSLFAAARLWMHQHSAPGASASFGAADILGFDPRPLALVNIITPLAALFVSSSGAKIRRFARYRLAAA